MVEIELELTYLAKEIPKDLNKFECKRIVDIFQKTYSAATSSIVDFYFYPKNTSIYYDNKEKSNNFPSTSNILFYRSNANWVDKIFLYFLFQLKCSFL